MGKHKVPSHNQGVYKVPLELRVQVVEHWVNNSDESLGSICKKFGVSEMLVGQLVSKYLEKPTHNITLQSRFTTDED